MPGIDKSEEEITISEVKRRGLLRESKKTIKRYINKTKRGEMDFPYRQATANSPYYISIDKLEKWKEKHSGG